MRGKDMKRPSLACGLMSGTSKDGVDVAIVEIGGKYPGNRIKLIHGQTIPFPAWLRRRLLQPGEKFSAIEVAALDYLLGEIFARAVLDVLKACKISPGEVMVIGNPGQTLLHRPRGIRFGQRRVKASLQVGSGAVISVITGIPTVSDFRAADIAAGGEGAPLVPIFDYVVLGSRKKTRIALNIGGISNVTVLPKDRDIAKVEAFDCGPGNCMIDFAVRYLTHGRRQYDINGKLALKGKPDREEVRLILAHPYFRRKPPKSTGWHEFGNEFTLEAITRMQSKNLDVADIVSTLTEATVEAIAGSIRKFVLKRMEVDEVIVTGGGVHNPAIMSGLIRRIPECKIIEGEAIGISSDWKEACAFAYLAYLSLKHLIKAQNPQIPPKGVGAKNVHAARGRSQEDSPLA